MTLDNDEPIDDAAAVLSPAELPVHAEAEQFVAADIVRPLRVWTVFGVFLATVLAAIAAQMPVIIALVAVEIARGGSRESAINIMSTPWGFVAAALPAQLAILAVWWLASSFGDPRARAFRAIGKASLRWPVYLCFAWASLGVLWLGGLLGQAAVSLLGDWESGMFTGLYESMTWPSGIVFVLFIALVPAFVEELFFRGYMQRRLLARWSPKVAIPVVALVFAAFHGTPIWAISVLPLGLWLGILAWQTGSLWPGIVCHAFVNGSVNVWRVGTALGVLPEEVSPLTTYTGLGIALALAVLSGWLLIHYQPTPELSQPVESFSRLPTEHDDR